MNNTKTKFTKFIKAYSLIISVLLASLAVLMFIQNQPSNIKITNITAGKWENPGGVQYTRTFNVTFKNHGPKDTGGITLNYKISGNQSNLPYNLRLVSHKQLGILHVEESKSIILFLETNLSYISQFTGLNFTATLMLDDVVLDEKLLTI